MLPFVRIGPMLIQLSGLALLAGLWFSFSAVEKEAGRLQLNAGAVINAITYGLVAGILGARLLYALEHINAYLVAPLSILSLSASALDPWGGLLIGTGVAYLSARRRAIPLRRALDALAPGVAVFMIAVGLSNALSGNGYGAPSDLPWAVNLWGELRHPTQIYETLIAIGIFLLWRFAPAGSAASGNSFWQILGLSAAARVFTEAFHGDSSVVLAGFRTVQVAALLLLVVAVYAARRWSSASSQIPAPAPRA